MRPIERARARFCGGPSSTVASRDHQPVHVQLRILLLGVRQRGLQELLEVPGHHLARVAQGR